MHDFKQSITASLGLNLFILKDIIEKHIYELWYTIEYHVCMYSMHTCMYGHKKSCAGIWNIYLRAQLVRLQWPGVIFSIIRTQLILPASL